MAGIDQAAAPQLTGASKTTRVLVAIYHFLVPVIFCGALLVDWLTAGTSREDFSLGVLSVVAVLLTLSYFMTGFGILKWRNWGRTFSLVLNWMNVFAALVSMARLRIEAIISVLLSCLVLWWLSLPVVKLEFRRAGETR